MRVAVVLPAYNEEARIARVLDVVTQAPGLCEIIVVSDGSTDATYQIAARTPGVTAIRLPENRGKGAAMMAGAMEADADAILFLDADLSGLAIDHIATLTEPVRCGRVDMAIGVFRGGRFITDLAQRMAPSISGQRCILRQRFVRAEHLADLRYGVEIALLRHAFEENWRIEDVVIRGVTHPMKEEKLGFARGTIARCQMYHEIFGGIVAPTLRSRRAQLTQLLKDRLGS